MEQMDWNATISGLPGANFLQTHHWAEIKKHNGWTNEFLTWDFSSGSHLAGAMLLQRRLFNLPFSVLYCPRGPLVNWNNRDHVDTVLIDMVKQAKVNNAIYLKIDPDLTIGTGIPGSADDREDTVGTATRNYLNNSGWIFSNDQIQFRNTVEIDLTPPENTLLSNMHQKTRYNIRLAERKGVAISRAESGGWEEIYHLYAETSARDGFVIRPWSYYQRVWQTLSDGGLATCLRADFEGELLAAIWVVSFGSKSHYLYGMSGSRHRELMPNHLLQWEGIKLAKSQNCKIYDMWGAPNNFDSPEALSGVFRFKQGFGGEVIRTIGAWDYPIRPNLYRLYTGILPRILEIMRQRGRVRTRRELSI